ncbi:MAG: hypothetical protein U0R27_05820 [Candidatus Nanopelagicales bacterium]
MLGAVDGGAVTVAEVIDFGTHLGEDTVRAALEALERMGRLRPESLAPGWFVPGMRSCGSAE